MSESPYRSLPSVDSLAIRLEAPGLSSIEMVAIARRAVDMARVGLESGAGGDAVAIGETLVAATLASQMQRAINATGVILHTNLGRAPLSYRAGEAARRVATAYSNAEFDLTTGERGKRGAYTADLLRALTGAEDALVVNNNAGAVLLALAAIAAGRSVPVSRSELVEIGGSYRLPDVMEASGAKMVEVGTTNKTRIGDFLTAIQIHDCAMVLKVHQANFEVSGFTASVNAEDLAGICQSFDIPLVYDVGSGLLDSTTPWLPETPEWLSTEPGVRQALQSGAGLVMFSGDKLLGGPQAGVIVGDAKFVSQLRDHPLRRALRVDSSTDAALAETLGAYARGTAGSEIPFWAMASAPFEQLHARSESLAGRIGASVEAGYSMVGAGSAPGAGIDSPAVRLSNEQHLYLRLLLATTPIVTRRDRGDLLLDLRAVDPEDDERVVEAILKCR